MSKNLIERSNNYILDRKIFTFDSDDRDKERWPNPAEFEISCPQNYTNIESIRILNINMPNYLYNICEHLQNNKLYISLDKINIYTITLEDGVYNPTNLATSIENFINNNTNLSNFSIIYNEVTNKIHFGNSINKFYLHFDHYDYTNCEYNCFDQHSKWGLGYLLGFDKKIYESQSIANGDKIFYKSSSSNTWITSSDYIIVSPKNVDLEYNQNIYFEIDKLNQSDEIKPFLNNKLTNSNNGRINSYFAKVPLIKSSSNQILVSKDFFLESVSYFQPLLEKLSKIKIKLRYHNGLMLDLKNYNINFSITLEINQIMNGLKNYDVRTPFNL
jgi:hypothetical protein